MFDKTVIVRGSTEYVPYEKKVTVNEHRAPTDDSIKLFEEMKAKAYQSLLDTIQINDNSLNVKALVYKDVYSALTLCKYALTLNGNQSIGEIRLNEYDLMDRQKVIDEIISQASQHVVHEIAKTVLTEGHKSRALKP
jgi:hypothetical protein